MRLNRVGSALIRPDTDGLFDIADEDFAIADLTGLGRLGDYFHRARRDLIGQNDFQFYLGQKIDRVSLPR